MKMLSRGKNLGGASLSVLEAVVRNSNSRVSIPAVAHLAVGHLAIA